MSKLQCLNSVFIKKKIYLLAKWCCLQWWSFSWLISWVVHDFPLLVGSRCPMFDIGLLFYIMISWQHPWCTTPRWACLFPHPSLRLVMLQTWNLCFVHYYPIPLHFNSVWGIHNLHNVLVALKKNQLSSLYCLSIT
jgi:hypothetical protein